MAEGGRQRLLFGRLANYANVIYTRLYYIYTNDKLILNA